MSWGAQNRSEDAKTPSASRGMSKKTELGCCPVQPYIGVVAKTHAGGSYDIDYDDGDKERGVGYAAIRSRGAGSRRSCASSIRVP